MKVALASVLIGAAAASSIKSTSKAGRKLLSKARRVGSDGKARSLEQNGEVGAWAASYSLKFEKCATSNEYYGGYFGGEQQDNNQNWNGLYQQRLVHFKLCPTDSCGSGCTGGDYVIDMGVFVEAYMEWKQEAEEQECEMVKENCYCENANDDEACEAQCYMSAGIYDQCVEQDNNNNNGQDENEVELEEALECAKLDIDEEAAAYYNYQQNGGQQNYYNGQNQNQQQQEIEYFVGPYCSADGSSILLGVFMDETCSYEAPSGIYEQFHYGKSLPYSTTSFIGNECISCKEVDQDAQQNQNQNYNYNNGNGNNNYNYQEEEPEVLEFCERLYEDAGKCESNLNVYGMYPNTLACEFIKGLSGGLKSRISSTFKGAASKTPAVLASLFAITTVAFGGVAYYFHTKLQRQNVNLVDGSGTMA